MIPVLEMKFTVTCLDFLTSNRDKKQKKTKNREANAN